MRTSFSSALAAALWLAACVPAEDVGATPPAADTPAAEPDMFEDGNRPLGMSDENIERMERALPSVNPLENDLRDLEAAVQMTEAFRIKPEGVRLSFSAKLSDGTVPFDEVFFMEPMDMVESATVAEHTKADHHLSMYRLAAADKLRMAAAQTALNELKANSDGNNQLNFGIEAISCREPAAAEDAPYSLSVFFRTHPDTDFIPMYMDMVMNKDDQFAVPQFWEPCAADAE